MSLCVEPRNQTPSFAAIVRKRNQPAAEGLQFSDADPVQAFKAALACEDFDKTAEPIISWTDKSRLAALDVDYHDIAKEQRPDRAEYYRTIQRLPIKPLFAWITHGGGLRLVFGPLGKLAADEVAAIARLLLRRELTAADGWEIKRDTRHPYYLRVAADGTEQHCEFLDDFFRVRNDPATARRIIFADYEAGPDVDEEQVSEWLTDHGLERGRRYDHSRCPIQPSGGGGIDPVAVLDGGIYCHACEANGRSHPGIRKPGFVPWQLLLDQVENQEPVRAVDHLRNAVRNLTHWQHARHFIADERTYRALLRLWHLRGESDAEDEARESLIRRVFFPPIPILRSNDTWVRSTDFSPVGHSSLEIFLRQLPALQYAAVDGEKLKTGLSPVKLAKFMDGFDLTADGYPNINVLRGVDLASAARPFEDHGIYALAPADPPFRYRRREDRDMTAVAAHFERCFPGIRLDLLKLLIAAKGVLQRGGNPEIPRLFIVGQSGASKSTTARLAANITGEVEAECGSGGDREKFIRGYADASMRSSFAIFNEVSKTGLSDSEIRGRFLSLERGMQYHAMYQGTACIRTPAAIVLTDCVLPPLFQNDAQLGRRFVLVDLGAGANETGQNWFDTCGSGSIQQWRNHPYSLGANADAADCLISEVIDEFFFEEGGPTFAEIARMLGFPLIGSAGDGEDAELREFYEAVKKLPEETEGHFAARGPGWKKFHKDNRTNGTADVHERFRELTAGGTDLQRLQGANWSKITGVLGMRLTVRLHRSWIGVRFWGRSGSEAAELTRSDPP
jgi:hypothetical protein